MTDIDSFLSFSGAPAAKFEEVGDIARGTVVAAQITQAMKFGTMEPDWWPSGEPKEQLVITLDTDEGPRRLFAVKMNAPGCQFRAILDAKAGRSFQVGGTLSVKYTGTEPSKTPGFAPRKLFVAKYEPPPAGTIVEPEPATPLSVEDF